MAANCARTGFEQGARCIAEFFLEGGVGIVIGVAGGVGLPVTDITVELGTGSGGTQVHAPRPRTAAK
jgi:hypothetical protein